MNAAVRGHRPWLRGGAGGRDLQRGLLAAHRARQREFRGDKARPLRPGAGGAGELLRGAVHKALAPALRAARRALALNLAGFSLRALGRLEDAAEPMRAAVECTCARKRLERRRRSNSGNLSELLVTIGRLPGEDGAVAAGEAAVAFADRSGDAFERMGKRTTHADALFQAGSARPRRGAVPRGRGAAKGGSAQPAAPLFAGRLPILRSAARPRPRRRSRRPRGLWRSTLPGDRAGSACWTSPSTR